MKKLDISGFIDTCQVYGIPCPKLEHMFHSERKWRFDFCWPDKKVALEVHGAIFAGGRHSGGVGQIGDMEKFNEAQLLGWKVLQIHTGQIFKAETYNLIKRAL